MYEPYPYPAEGPELGQCERLTAEGNEDRMLRGGAFWVGHPGVRCAYRLGDVARVIRYGVGFRVVVRP